MTTKQLPKNLRANGDSPDHIDLATLAVWLSPTRDVDAIISLFTMRTFSNRASAAMVLVDRAADWTVDLAASAIHDPDSFARLRALGETKVPLTEYARLIAREYVGADKAPRFARSHARRQECQQAFLRAAFTCATSRSDDELLLTLRQRGEFQMLVPVVIGGVAQLDLSRLSWMLEHDFNPKMIARAFAWTGLEATNAEDARWVVVRTARQWSASLVRAVWDDADRLRAVGASKCARAALTRALSDLTLAYSRATSSRDANNVRLLIRAARAGLLCVPLDPEFDSRPTWPTSHKNAPPFPGLLLATSRTLRPGDTPESSPVPILLQAPTLHPLIEAQLSKRDFRVHDPEDFLASAIPAVNDLLRLIRSPLISPLNAVVAVERAIKQACFGIGDSEYLSGDAPETVGSAAREWLASLTTRAQHVGSRSWHHEVMTALLERLAGEHTLYVDVLRRWLCLEPEVLLRCLREQPAIAPTAHQVRQIVLHLLALANGDALGTCSMLNAAYPEWMPSQADVESVLGRLVSSENAAVRARGLRLVEWLAAEYR